MSSITRRQFLQHSAVAGGLLAGAPYLNASESRQSKRSATDLVSLGKSGVKFTRLGFGTGSDGGSVQRALGQDQFTRLIRYAYDQGIRYFDTADNYAPMHTMLATALKGMDRSTYFIQTKIKLHDTPSVAEELDRFRKELNTDYFDSVLLHCTATSDWPERWKRLRDDLSTMKEKKITRMHGASCHGLSPLKTMPTCSWLDVALVRINHNGVHMDGEKGEWAEPGKHDVAVAEIKKIRNAGIGVIGMKLIGNGEFTKPEDREASIKYVVTSGLVDVAVIGFKSPAEVDEAIQRMNRHLNA